MPGEMTPVVGAATLASVAVGEAPVDPERGVKGPYGLTGLGRVDPEGLSFDCFNGCHIQHGSSPYAAAPKAASRIGFFFQGGVMKPQAGPFTRMSISLAKFTAPRYPAYGPP